MGDYREIRPEARLAKHVECFWTLRPEAGDTSHRVTPDGCTDLIFRLGGARVRGFAVGSMTRPLIDAVTPGEEIVGVRFHPAMSHGVFRAPVAELTDQVVDFASLWGKDARAVEQRIADAGTVEERAAAISAAIRVEDAITPVQRVALYIVENRGAASAGELARHAGLSARQFRRLCIEQTGVGPKMLCRIVRFRSAVSNLASGRGDWAAFAVDRGYYDQAHFINEFREFSGLTPESYASVFSNTPERDPHNLDS